MVLRHLGLVGYGEVGKTFAAGLRPFVACGQRLGPEVRRRDAARPSGPMPVPPA